MSKNQIYSFELYDWVKEQLPKEIIQAMHDTGWNPFGIYELVKEGLSLKPKRNLTSRRSRAADACAECGRRLEDHQAHCSKYEF